MPHDVLVLTGDDAAQLPIQAVMTAVRDAYVALSTGQAEMSPKHRWHFGVGMNSAFGSHIHSLDVMAIKLGTSRPSNPDRGLPRAYSQIILHDPLTGAPLAILDATSITAMRTGAAAAVGAAALGAPLARVATVVGTGVVAVWAVRALAVSFPLEEVRVVGRTPEHAAAFAARVAHEHPFPVTAASISDAIPDAQIIVTSTPSTEQLVPDVLVAPGTHISSVGSDAPGKQELEVATILRARYVTDSRAQALDIGEANVAHARGLFAAHDIAAEIGEVLAGTAVGRQDPEQVTVFDSSGVAVQDAATALAIVDMARRDGLGQMVRL
jgi:alanine dehydrogenase